MAKKMSDIQGIDLAINVKDSASQQSTLNRRVCLHPEHLDAIESKELTVIPVDLFVEHFCNISTFYMILKREGVLIETRTGVVKYQEMVQQPKCDGLQCDTFMEIAGISRDMSNEIYQEIKNVNHGNVTFLSLCLSSSVTYSTSQNLKILLLSILLRELHFIG